MCQYCSSAHKCPNCKSLDCYFVTVSTEECINCGLFFDYWGSGPNEVYLKMLEVRDAMEIEDVQSDS